MLIAEKIIPTEQQVKEKEYLDKIRVTDSNLLNYFEEKVEVDETLTRQLVSFQANKKKARYRWYKYKEAFSTDLVQYLLNLNSSSLKGPIFDPFTGAGTALFSASEIGLQAEGIELLPVGKVIVEAGIVARNSKTRKEIIPLLEKWLIEKPWNTSGRESCFQVLRITNGAYSKNTDKKIKRYLYLLQKESKIKAKILEFALLCVLESISYTRKDGQYLRWDYRSGRRSGQNTFDKGKIYEFDEAITLKFEEIIFDMKALSVTSDLFEQKKTLKNAAINLYEGSCLDVLPTLPDKCYTGIITSPPYCNRYDYTRTYALEHAVLGIDEVKLVALRQAMVSCTVENKTKELLLINSSWGKAISACDNQPLLQILLKYLDFMKAEKALNNSGIARMVRGYFYEMSCVIQECYRVLKPGGYFYMVNDNVRYAGAAISVDLILSKIAEDLGFTVKNILVLPKGKGNSSQQMGKHGREALRKCIYVWKKD